MLEGFVPFPDEFKEKYRDMGYWVDKSLREEFADGLEYIPIRLR